MGTSRNSADGQNWGPTESAPITPSTHIPPHPPPRPVQPLAGTSLSGVAPGLEKAVSLRGPRGREGQGASLRLQRSLYKAAEDCLTFLAGSQRAFPSLLPDPASPVSSVPA